MTAESPGAFDAIDKHVRLHIFRAAARTGGVPQAPEIAAELGRAQADVEQSLRRLAAGKVLILAPNDGHIWAANPFCAVPSAFRVEANGKTYWGICIWDALGILATLGPETSGRVQASCGDCSEPMRLEVEAGTLRPSEGVLHFGVPAHHWWDNIGFT